MSVFLYILLFIAIFIFICINCIALLTYDSTYDLIDCYFDNLEDITLSNLVYTFFIFPSMIVLLIIRSISDAFKCMDKVKPFEKNKKND